jgi:hypothetical protein
LPREIKAVTMIARLPELKEAGPESPPQPESCCASTAIATSRRFGTSPSRLCATR